VEAMLIGASFAAVEVVFIGSVRGGT
jgi:hypothetical protein